MATDYWPDQDGRIFDCLTVNAYAESTDITANYSVILGTSTAGIFKVSVPAAYGDACGVALKTPVAVGDYIPVMLLGVMKMLVAGFGAAATANKVLVNSFLINSSTSGVVAIGNANSGTQLTSLISGVSHILGLALQTGAAASDEVLVFVGRSL